MSDNKFAKNLENNQYFLSLPKFVQESIKQTSPDVRSEEDLRKIAENLIREAEPEKPSGTPRF
ncbi:hypothetical protein [Caproiciproducens sp. CPB-2]|uniref:hypothetical protein n=1 Tax=unclassified Caproiciproducens TaxID=2643836 RepID=UPI0023DAB5A6|nr:hypothetical protein [Caproiciproducens sp. CPB-2]MDF1493266.1 hypothetical protein [Caproiciproducens sp. CPB-2]